MGTTPPFPDPPRGLRIEERAPSITTLIVDAVKAVSSGSPGPVCSSDMLTAVQVEGSGLQLSRFAGFSGHGLSRHGSSPFAAVTGAPSHRLEHLVPEVMKCVLPELLPTLLPAAVAAALPAASAAAAESGVILNPATLPALLESALAPALAAVLPGAVLSTLSVLLRALNVSDQQQPATHAHQQKASAAVTTAPSSAAFHAGSDGNLPSANEQPQQPSQRQPSLDQQGDAELQLVRLLFGADNTESATVPPPACKPSTLEIVDVTVAARNSTGASSPAAGNSSEPAPAVCSPTGSPAGSVTSGSSRPSSAHHAADEVITAADRPAGPPMVAARRPSLAALASVYGDVCLTVAGDEMFSRRLSDTNYGSYTAAANAAACADKPTIKASGSAGPQQLHARSSRGSVGGGVAAPAGQHSRPPSWGQPEDVISSGDDAISTCSGGDMPSPYGELCMVGGGSGAGTGAAINSSANSFLLRSGGAAGDGGAMDSTASAVGLYGIRREDLLERLQQQVQSQQIASPFTSPAELLLTAAGNTAGAAGRSTLASHLAAAQAAGAQSQVNAASAALFMQHQQQAAAQQQLHQLQQLQALVSGRSVGSLPDAIADLGAPPSPALAANLQWRRTSGTKGAFGADLWATDADALGLAALAQQQQQAFTAAGLMQQQAQQQQLLAAVAAANAAGRSLHPEEMMALNGAAAGLPLPSTPSAVALNGQAAAASATDLSSYMDTALRRMLLVSPQVASELARACGAFSGAHTQLHHLCCVISEQLLDVAAMAPEVAAALLRALAAHRARGAQATDVDPRVMGRILQLLRAGPAGRQLCLVSLEQWVDGLSRIHKRRAYMDTILHNYQLTLKRLVQAMGHQVHAVNMSLPRQLLNDLSPRALLLLTAELAPYPLLQPRRWSEEIIWTVTQMHAMGVDMATCPSVAGLAAAGAQAPTSAFQWELRRALAATAEDINAAGGAAVACGQSPPTGAGCPLGSFTAVGSGASGSTTPGGTAVPWAAHAALHRHLLLGLRRVQSRFFSERLRKVHGLYGESVEALLRSSLPQDVLVPEREMVVLVSVLLMLECRIRPEEFDAAFGRDLQRCLAVSSVDEVAGRLRCGLVPDSPLRIDPHKSRALSQLLKLGPLSGQAPF